MTKEIYMLILFASIFLSHELLHALNHEDIFLFPHGIDVECY